MSRSNQHTIAFSVLAFYFGAVLFIAGGSAQAQQPPAKTQADDVLRVNTELVQTAITVVDKNGKFVEGLDRGQFELTVDGKPRPISFFERITAGSPREQQLTARSEPGATPAKTPAIPPSTRGRTIVFFVDDLHLSLDSMNRTKQMLRRFSILR